jgi:hypothetical protein
MGIFKKKVIKQIDGGTWGHLVTVHNIDVDTLSREMRCVEKKGVADGGKPVTLIRVFRPKEAQQNGIAVTGWETFDQNPELIVFEGYLTRDNEAYLERRK